MPLPSLLALPLLVAAATPPPHVVTLPGPVPSFVAAVDADPDGARIAVVVGSSDAGTRLAVLDPDDRLVFLRDALQSPAGAVALGRSHVVVAGPDDPHAPGAAVRVYALTTSNDRARVLHERARAPDVRVPLGDHAVLDIELAPDEGSFAVASVGLVTQTPRLIIVDASGPHDVALPFVPTSMVYAPDGARLFVGGDGLFVVDVRTRQGVWSERATPVSALDVVGGDVRIGTTREGPVAPRALAAVGALGCADGRPAFLVVDREGQHVTMLGSDETEGLPCPRFGGGALLVGATHGLSGPPTLVMWRPTR